MAIYAFIVYAFLDLGANVHPEMKKRFDAHKAGIYIHIFFAIVSLLIGPFQFLENLRRKRMNLHKIMGYIYINSSNIGSAAGLYVGMFSYGGLISSIGFGILACLTIIFNFSALILIIKKKVK